MVDHINWKPVVIPARLALGALLWFTGAIVSGASPVYMAIALGHGKPNASPRTLWLAQSLRSLAIALILVYFGLLVANGLSIVKARRFAVLWPSSTLVAVTAFGGLLGVAVTVQADQVRTWVGAGYTGTAAAVLVSSVAACLQALSTLRSDASRDVT
jgi:hypothetical protein